MKSGAGGFWALFVVALIAGVIVAVAMAEIIDQHSDDLLWLFGQPQKLLMLVVLYPIIEEISFRGVLQGALLRYPPMRTRYLGITSANILTSIAFVAMHLIHHTELWAVLVFIPSLVFGYFRDFTGRLYSSVALHMVYNLMFLSVLG